MNFFCKHKIAKKLRTKTFDKALKPVHALSDELTKNLFQPFIHSSHGYDDARCAEVLT